MSRHTYALALLPALLLAAPVARAQAKADEVFAKAFFDPQLVLKHASAIGLTAQQRKAILDELKSTQVALVPLQVDMAEPALELQGLVESTRVDEARALARIDQVLKIENEVKKRQAIFTHPGSAFLVGNYKVSEPVDGMFLLAPTQAGQVVAEDLGASAALWVSSHVRSSVTPSPDTAEHAITWADGATRAMFSRSVVSDVPGR